MTKKRELTNEQRRAADRLLRAATRPRIHKRRVALALTLAPLALGWAARTGTVTTASATRSLASTLVSPISKPLTRWTHPAFNRSQNTCHLDGRNRNTCLNASKKKKKKSAGSSKQKQSWGQWSKQRAADWALGMPVMAAAAVGAKKAKNKVRKTWSKPLKAGETRATRAKNVFMLGAVPAMGVAKRAGSAALQRTVQVGGAALRGAAPMAKRARNTARTWWTTR